MRHLLIILLTLLVTTAASAFTTTPPEEYTYRPLVEEGKQWVYITSTEKHNNYDVFTIQGEEVIDGVTWKKVWMSDEEGRLIVEDPVSLIREEDKKVYIYPLHVWKGTNYVNCDSRYNHEVYGYLDYLLENEGIKVDFDIEKSYPCMIYDFSLDVGEKFISSMFWPWTTMDSLLGNSIEAILYESFGDMPLRIQSDWIYNAYYYTGFCEGIGVLEYGFFICPYPMCTRHTCIPPDYGPELKYVITAAGEVLYEEKSRYGEHLRWLDDRYVWVYESEEEGVLTERYYAFNGTVEMEDGVYKRLNLVRETVSRRNPDNSLSVVSDERADGTVALMRRNVNRVIVRYPSENGYDEPQELYATLEYGKAPEFDMPVPGSVNTLDERLDQMTGLGLNGYYFMVYWAYPVDEHDGIPDGLYPRPIVKGIGNCGFGLLHDVGSEEALKFRFSRLTDREGNVIVTSEDIMKLKPVPENVETVTEPNPIRVLGDRVDAVSADGTTVTLTVVSADGRTVAQASGEGSATIAIDQLSHGVYVVRVIADGKYATSKIIR